MLPVIVVLWLLVPVVTHDWGGPRPAISRPRERRGAECAVTDEGCVGGTLAYLHP